jgi:putative RNA 2'-phosphotransferase
VREVAAMTGEPRDLKSLSKVMALVLRHQPERFGVTLDPEGYVSLEELLVAVDRMRPGTSRADLVAVVEGLEPAKRRFTISGDSIRANYGHSLRARVSHEEATPPAVLYHGTWEGAVNVILERGLLPMGRQYVHLTTNRDLARRIGSRHGKPVVVCVDARRAHDGGVRFYRANDSFWLVDTLPPGYLRTG